MTFFGQENEVKEPVAAEAPLRTYTYKKASGREITVEAHFLQFTAGHVNFWKTRADDKQDTLILSEANGNVHSLKEIAS